MTKCYATIESNGSTEVDVASFIRSSDSDKLFESAKRLEEAIKGKRILLRKPGGNKPVIKPDSGTVV